MEVMRENLFITSPERVASLFIYCLERPKKFSDFSMFFKIQTSLYYKNNFLDTLVSKGIFRLEYIGRKVYLYSLFGDEFREYYKQMIQISPMFKEARNALLKDADALIKFFDSDLFRDFWTEDLLKHFTRENFKKPDFLLGAFLAYLSYPITIFFLSEGGKEMDFESAKLLVSSNLYFTMKSFGSSLPPEFFVSLEKYFTKERLEKALILKETEYYKAMKEISMPYLKSILPSLQNIIQKLLKRIEWP